MQYVGKLADIRKPISAAEFELYWPGSRGVERRNYVAELYSILRLDTPFSLNEIRDFDWKHYNAVQCYAVFRESDAALLTNHLVKVNPDAVREHLNADGNVE